MYTAWYMEVPRLLPSFHIINITHVRGGGGGGGPWRDRGSGGDVGKGWCGGEVEASKRGQSTAPTAKATAHALRNLLSEPTVDVANAELVAAAGSDALEALGRPLLAEPALRAHHRADHPQAGHQREFLLQDSHHVLWPRGGGLRRDERPCRPPNGDLAQDAAFAPGSALAAACCCSTPSPPSPCTWSGGA